MPLRRSLLMPCSDKLARKLAEIAPRRDLEATPPSAFGGAGLERDGLEALPAREDRAVPSRSMSVRPTTSV